MEGQLPGSDARMHTGEQKMKLVSSLDVLNMDQGVWKQEKIYGDKCPLGIRDGGLALLKSSTGPKRLRPFLFGGYCGHGTCVYNSVHELCFDPERERYEWSEIAHDDAEGHPLKKRSAAAVAFAADGREQVCVFAGHGPSNSAIHQSPPTKYFPTSRVPGVICWTNELHFLDVTDVEKG